MDAEAYVRDRLETQIAWYDTKSLKAQRAFKWLRVTEIVAAASIPLLAGYVDVSRPNVTLIIGVLGAGIAVIAGVLGLYQFERHWVDYRTTCESLKKEKYLFLTGSEPFDQEPSANYALLVQRVETLVSKENTNWAQYMMKPHDQKTA
jgi:hypothetical protein